MPAYTTVNVPYIALGEFKVWASAGDAFAVDSLAKDTDPGSPRQHQFEQELIQLAENLKTEYLPIFIRWQNVGCKRMDKGCIGHALASGFITAHDGPGGVLEYVRIAR